MSSQWRSRAGRTAVAAVATFLALDAGCADKPTATSEQLTPQAESPWNRLNDTEAGYTLVYPADWSLEGQVVASDFALGARCRSVRVVDFAPPPGSGAAAPMLHSFVQVCAKPTSSVGALEAFMKLTYGDRLDVSFKKTQINRLAVYETRQQEPIRMLFVEIAEHIVQIIAVVEAEPARRPERRTQVETILESFAAL